jgi:hypothetical protein
LALSAKEGKEGGCGSPSLHPLPTYALDMWASLRGFMPWRDGEEEEEDEASVVDVDEDV